MAPLRPGPVRVGLVREAHPGIDFVLDTEVIRRTHEQVTHGVPSCYPFQPSSLASSRRNEEESITSPTA